MIPSRLAPAKKSPIRAAHLGAGSPTSPSPTVDAMTSEPGRTLYFAYGANMAATALQARGVKAHSGEPALLPGFALRFGLPGIPMLEPAFATIVEADDSEVHGVLFSLGADDLLQLDACEDCPRSYRRISVTVVRASGSTAVAHTYQSTVFESGLRPSARYRDLIVRGASEAGLPSSWVEWIRAHEPDGIRLPHWAWQRIIRSRFLSQSLGAAARGIHQLRRFPLKIRRTR